MWDNVIFLSLFLLPHCFVCACDKVKFFQGQKNSGFIERTQGNWSISTSQWELSIKEYQSRFFHHSVSENDIFVIGISLI